MTIISNGGVNPAAFGVPDLYVQFNAPPAAALPGAPSDRIGIVGTASWGPKNSPVPFSDEAGGGLKFGPMNARKYDIMTQVHAAVMQGARNFRCVRVTDGTDLAASATIQTNGLTATSKYTGSRGNLIEVKIDTGTKAATWKVTVMMPGMAPEVFDNIPGTLNAAWVNIAAAINSGQAGVRGASQIIVATAGASVASPTVGGSTILAGGTDGAGTITGSTLVGADTSPRTGMYALRDSGVDLFLLADCDDSTTWAAQAAFALSQMAYCYGVSPSGQTVSDFVTAAGTAGVDTPWFKAMLGDWIYMLDPVAGYVRLVSPQGFAAGNKAVIGPHNSSLNKPLQGVVGTQKSYQEQVYSAAELQLISQARGDVIVMNPPGGEYPAVRFGYSTSSDRERKQETYTTMTNYLAKSLDASGGLGRFIGDLITPDQMREAANSLGGFLQEEWDAERIGNAQNTIPYSVQIDSQNNPNDQAAIGVEKASVMVQYLSVLEVFLVDLTGGQTVQIQSALDRAY